MSHEIAAAGFAALVAATHYAGHRTFGDEVYFSKAAVSRAGLLTAVVAGAGYYVAGGPPL